MRFLFDMGVDIRVAMALAEQGHDVIQKPAVHRTIFEP
jgi:hypothetical protein